MPGQYLQVGRAREEDPSSESGKDENLLIYSLGNIHTSPAFYIQLQKADFWETDFSHFASLQFLTRDSSSLLQFLVTCTPGREVK